MNLIIQKKDSKNVLVDTEMQVLVKHMLLAKSTNPDEQKIIDRINQFLTDTPKEQPTPAPSSANKIDWKYFFGGKSGRTYDMYYKTEINGTRCEKLETNSGVSFCIGKMDLAKVKYKTEAELLKALDGQ